MSARGEWQDRRSVPVRSVRWLPGAWDLDPRALAAFRVGLGAVVLGDLIARSFDLRAHYTDAGAFPRSVGSLHSLHAFHYSLHTLSGELWWQALLFVLLGAAALSMMLGFRTRTAVLATWILFVSMIARNEIILQGSDNVVKLLLFWSSFLPLGQCWSLDSRKRTGATPAPVGNLASLAIQLQVAYVFVFAGLLKVGNDTWTGEASAVARAFNWAPLATPLANSAAGLPPELLKAASVATPWAEILAPLLLFVPFRPEWFRVAGLVVLAAMVVAFQLCFRLGSWPYTAYAATLIFVPKAVWDRVAPMTLGNAEAAHRGRDALAGALLVYVTAFNVDVTLQGVRLPELLRVPAYVLSIDQQWVMFSPAPPRLGGWYVVEGRTNRGARVFPVPEAGPTDFDTDHWPSDVYATHRWRLYMCQWNGGVSPRGARHLLEYACRRDPRLSEARLHQLESVGALDGSRQPPRRREVAKLSCVR